MNQVSSLPAGSELNAIVAKGAETLGICLPPEANAAFNKYYGFLEQRGQNVNLTAISGTEDVARLHFLDSLALLNCAQFKNMRVIDIGSGAGFPGIPLKIAEPTIDLALLDATSKRVAFLSDLCHELRINAAFHHARAEEAAHMPTLREHFDIAVSRAVAQLNVLCELCLPFIRIGGTFLAMKALESDEEIASSRNAIAILGCEFESVYDYKIPETDVSRRIVIIRKTSPTPDAYPRRFARIQRKPL